MYDKDFVKINILKECSMPENMDLYIDKKNIQNNKIIHEDIVQDKCKRIMTIIAGRNK